MPVNKKAFLEALTDCATIISDLAALRYGITAQRLVLAGLRRELSCPLELTEVAS